MQESNEIADLIQNYWIVIPTYNEKENIEPLIEEILKTSPDISIIIVDDDSPDGTGDIADMLSQRYSNVHVIHREGKLGVGTAFVAGFKYAMESGAKYLIAVDADFSHQPRYLPEFIKKSRDYDLVIGSRFIPGGRIDNRNLFRNFVSLTGNLFVRLILGLKPKDCTSGYRCYSAGLLREICMDAITSNGYGIQVETLYRCKKKGFKVGEIPIVFPDRKFGKSKLTKQQFIEVIAKVLALRLSKQ